MKLTDWTKRVHGDDSTGGYRKSPKINASTTGVEVSYESGGGWKVKVGTLRLYRPYPDGFQFDYGCSVEVAVSNGSSFTTVCSITKGGGSQGTEPWSSSDYSTNGTKSGIYPGKKIKVYVRFKASCDCGGSGTFDMYEISNGYILIPGSPPVPTISISKTYDESYEIDSYKYYNLVVGKGTAISTNGTGITVQSRQYDGEFGGKSDKPTPYEHQFDFSSNIVTTYFGAYLKDDNYENPRSETSDALNRKELLHVRAKLPQPSLSIDGNKKDLSVGETLTVLTNDDGTTGVSDYYKSHFEFFTNQGVLASREYPVSQGIYRDSYPLTGDDDHFYSEVFCKAYNTGYLDHLDPEKKSKDYIDSNFSDPVSVKVHYQPKGLPPGFEVEGLKDTLLPSDEITFTWGRGLYEGTDGRLNHYKITAIPSDESDREITLKDSYIEDEDITKGQTISLVISDLVSRGLLTYGCRYKFQIVFSCDVYGVVEGIVVDVDPDVRTYKTEVDYLVGPLLEVPDILYPNPDNPCVTVNSYPRLIFRCRAPSIVKDLLYLSSAKVSVESSSELVEREVFIKYDESGVPSIDGDPYEFTSVIKDMDSQYLYFVYKLPSDLSIDAGQGVRNWKFRISCSGTYTGESDSLVSETEWCTTLYNFESQLPLVSPGDIISSSSVRLLGNLCLNCIDGYCKMTSLPEFSSSRYFVGTESRPDELYVDEDFKGNIICSDKVVSSLLTERAILLEWLKWLLYQDETHVGLYDLVASYGKRGLSDQDIVEDPNGIVVLDNINGNSPGDMIYASDRTRTVPANYYKGNIFNNILDILRYML